MELVRHVRYNAFLIILKCSILASCLLLVFAFISFSRSAESAIDQSFSKEADANLYSLVDTLTDADEFSTFRDSQTSLAELGAFYDRLNNDVNLKYISSFDQQIPIENFRGGEQFDVSYGVDLTPQGVYFNQDSGKPVRDVKSIQMNENAFDFYNLMVDDGQALPWGSIDYADAEVPVLMGSAYKGIYSIGDTFYGNFYGKQVNFRVQGFLRASSSIFYKSQLNYYLDDKIVLPYPPSLQRFDPEDQFFFGILSFAMLNGDIVAPRSMSTDEVIGQISIISSSSGFSDWTLVNVPSYLIQFNLIRQIINANLALLVLINTALFVAVVILVAAINNYLARRRRKRDSVLRLLGHGRPVLSRLLMQSWAIEQLVTVIAFGVGYAYIPNHDSSILLGITGIFFAVAALDMFHQQYMLGKWYLSGSNGRWAE